jgi:hypothetical protein
MNPTPIRIKDSSFSNAIGRWIAAIACLAILSFNIVDHSHQKHSMTPVGVGVFGLVGAGLLVAAVDSLISDFRYGRSVFESSMIPALFGGSLRGTVRIPKPFVFNQPIQLRFACEQLVSAGKSSHYDTLWEKRSMLTDFTPGASVSEIQICFDVPGHYPPSSGNRVRWKLEVKAKTAGVHYAAIFVIPVRAPLETEVIPARPDSNLANALPDPPRRQPVDPHVHFNPLPGGGGQFDLLGGKNSGMGFPFIVFGAIFVAIPTFLSNPSRPDHVKISSKGMAVICLIGLAIALAGVAQLIIKTTVSIRHGLLTVDRKVGPFTSHKEYRAAEVHDFSVAFDGIKNGQSSFKIEVSGASGRWTKICGAISSEAEAEWLAAEFKRELHGQ